MRQKFDERNILTMRYSIKQDVPEKILQLLGCIGHKKNKFFKFLGYYDKNAKQISPKANNSLNN